jgi:hypothetical protein
MPGDLRMPGRPCSVCSPLRPLAPRFGSSPIAQAPAQARPSFLNINIKNQYEYSCFFKSVFYHISRTPRSGSSPIFQAPALAQPSFLT